MRIATDTKCEQVDISASRSEFREMATAVKQLIPGETASFDGDSGRDVSPWDRSLARLAVAAQDGPVCATVVDDAVVITGSRSMLDVLTSYMEFPEDAHSGYHHHHEYFEGDQYIDPKSVPLIFTMEE